jgi:hypothetical protein
MNDAAALIDRQGDGASEPDGAASRIDLQAMGAAGAAGTTSGRGRGAAITWVQGYRLVRLAWAPREVRVQVLRRQRAPRGSH